MQTGNREQGIGVWEMTHGHKALIAARSLEEAQSLFAGRYGSGRGATKVREVAALDKEETVDNKRDSETGHTHYCTLREWIADRIDCSEPLPAIIDGPEYCEFHGKVFESGVCPECFYEDPESCEPA